MGLIKAVLGAGGSVLADQWKEFFYCDSLDKDTLMVKGQKRIGPNSSNTKGSDNIISNGSAIAVADGQCMLIVDQGKVVEVCAEPGQFTFDTSSEPSIFAGKLGTSIIESFKTWGKRITYGGDTGKDQRVYYINTKELLDNKFGTANPIPFRVVDSRLKLDIDVSLRCSGVYSYKIADPIVFYTNICANVPNSYSRSELETQLKQEFLSAMQPAFAKLSDMELRPNQIIAHNTDLENALNEVLSEKWGNLRGLKVVSVALGSVTLPDEDAQMIKDAQRRAMLMDPTYAGAAFVDAQTEAMKAAANNSAGAMTGFMGLGMAMNAGGGAGGAANLYAMGQGQGAPATGQAPAAAGVVGGISTPGWTCPKCGATATGKFCPECGTARPAEASGWTCTKCGTLNKGKFCADCGSPKPAGAPLYKCDKCGWEPEDPYNPPKFCPECGDLFDDNDIKK
ncbi:MAG: SPFH domain-containing protein [Lachnospiraceae bacterium]|nr:SPFH domain-containing protein [Lachnospiraceae bacterium]MBP5248982.1 SPFH domain-containing protein [Lachnospiraceae bacterium]